MIRINLAKTLITESSNSTISGGENSQLKDILKVVFIILPFLGLFLFERNNISKKETVLRTAAQKQSQINKSLNELSAVESTVAQIEAQKKELKDKFSVLNKIFSLRQKKMKAIVALQETLDQKSWITDVDFNENKLKVVGYSSSVALTQNYISKLSELKKIFFNVRSNNISKEDSGKTTIYKFELAIVLQE